MSFFEDGLGKPVPPVYESTHPDSAGRQFDSYPELKKHCPECAGDGLPYIVKSRKAV